MTKEQAKQFSEIMTDWLLRAVTIQFKNEDDEYQQMADYFNSRIIIDEKKLDELAKNTRIYYDEYRIIRKDEDEIYYAEDLDVVFKAGYRKAKDE